jgi:hypothetical protein
MGADKLSKREGFRLFLSEVCHEGGYHGVETIDEKAL